MNRIRYTFFIAAMLLICSVKAQIGINTTAPDNSAALDINLISGQKAGILIPRLVQAQRITITSPAKGLMVYDLTDNMFYVNLTAGVHNWLAVNPWVTAAASGSPGSVYTHSSVTNVGIGTNAPSVALEVIGDVKASNSVITPSLNVSLFPVNALMPAGGIIMWNGSSAPTGWGLCDGSTYTTSGGTIVSPDLRGRFVLSIGTNTAPAGGDINPAYTLGQKGGENTHLLSAAESGLPVHTHTSPPHGHGSANGVYSSGPGPTDVYAMGNAECCTNAGTPPFSSVAVSINASTSQNASAAHENRPPYYVLAYIIKLP